MPSMPRGYHGAVVRFEAGAADDTSRSTSPRAAPASPSGECDVQRSAPQPGGAAPERHRQRGPPVPPAKLGLTVTCRAQRHPAHLDNDGLRVCTSNCVSSTSRCRRHDGPRCPRAQPVSGFSGKKTPGAGRASAACPPTRGRVGWRMLSTLRAPPMMVFAAIVALAVVAGLFGSMLGVGGGVIMVPVLSIGFGLPIKVAIATSMVYVIATSAMAQLSFVKRGMTNPRLGFLLEVASAVGAVGGGLTAVLIDGRVSAGRFAGVPFYVVWQMDRAAATVPAETAPMPSSYYDPTEDRQVATACTAWARVRAQLRRRQRLRAARRRRRRVQGADHERAHGRAAQGDHRHQQPDDRRHGRDRRCHLLRARLHGPALGGAGRARHPGRRAARAPPGHRICRRGSSSSSSRSCSPCSPCSCSLKALGVGV